MSKINLIVDPWGAHLIGMCRYSCLFAVVQRGNKRAEAWKGVAGHTHTHTHTCMHACMHTTYIHTYIHNIHTYYIHTYIFYLINQVEVLAAISWCGPALCTCILIILWEPDRRVPCNTRGEWRSNSVSIINIYKESTYFHAQIVDDELGQILQDQRDLESHYELVSI